MNLIDAVIRTKRKTIAIIVHSDGRVVVRAPLKANKKQIEDFVTSKIEWIEKHRSRVNSTTPARAPRKFLEGEILLYLGKEFPLKINNEQKEILVWKNGTFHLHPDANGQAAEVFTLWYKQKAKELITERVTWYARRYGFHPSSIRITSARTRWGSCSSRGGLSFTWRLIMAPIEVIDYVVVHELCHLIERNHGPNFWGQVMRIEPDYKQKRDWLKQNGIHLTLD